MLRRAVCLTAVALGGLVPLGVQAAQTGGDVTVGEQAGTAQVVLRAAPGAAVRWTTVDGTATAGGDYSPATATTTFGAGQAQVVLNIPVVQDGLVEGDEVFGVAIVEVSDDGVQAPTIANVTIRDDDFLPGACANPRTGTSGVDTIDGGPAGDRITALEGDDTVRAGEGDDCAIAGPGNDRVFGGSGTDTLDGETGDDLLAGGAGNDGIRGGAGRHRMLGAAGADRIAGGVGSDIADGGGGNDVIDAGTGADRVLGGPGADRLSGGRGPDDVRAGAGDDRVAARDGTPDRVDCGPGRDVVAADRLDVVSGCETVRRR